MKKLTALGADIFAGLFTYGVKQAGFEVLGHLEHGNYGVRTCQLNFPKLEVRIGRENWREQEFKGKVDFMYSNPPCAAWSVARSKDGVPWEQQTARLSCVDDCVTAGLVIKPKAWCWESVTRAWTVGQAFVIHQAERWNDAGYHCTVLLQDNQYLGTPQVRRRMFLIAHKHPLVWPKLVNPTTVAEAFAQLPKKLPPPQLEIPPLQPYWKRLWKLSENHAGYFRATHENEGRGPKKLEGRIPSVHVRRLNLDKPAPVMLGSDLRLHPTEPRYVNWYEWLSLVGLPLSWKSSSKSLSSSTVELSRAVMPAVGKWVAKAVADGLKLPPLKGRPTTTLVNFMDPENKSTETLFTFDGFTTKPFDLTTAPPPPKRSGLSRKGSGARIRELLLKGKDVDSILATIHKEFPSSKAKKGDVQFHQYNMKKKGELK